DNVGCLAVLRQLDVEMIYIGANIADHSCNVGAPVGVGAVIKKNSDGSVELSNAVRASRNAQLRAECDLEKTVGDLGIGERSPFGTALDPDAFTFGPKPSFGPNRRSCDGNDCYEGGQTRDAPCGNMLYRQNAGLRELMQSLAANDGR